MQRSLPTTRLLFAASCLAVLLPADASATTFVAPRNFAELARRADAVVLAEAGRSLPWQRGRLVFTDCSFEVIDALSGELETGDTLDVRSPGGEAGGRIWAVPGAPEFNIGERYLLCLERQEDAVWIPLMLSYGVFRESLDVDGRPLLVPDGELNHATALPRPDGAAVDPMVAVDRQAFLAQLRDVLTRDGDWSLDATRVPLDSVPVDERPVDRVPVGDGGGAGVPAGCSFISSGGRPFRWNVFDRGGTATIFTDSTGDLSLSHGGFPLVQEALDLWMGVEGSGVNLRYGGTRPVAVACRGQTGAVADFILFNDPCSDIGDLDRCSGILAFGGPEGRSTHLFDGQPWISVDSWIVVVNNGAGCLRDANYRVMLAHELGHGLGFGHVDDSGALMFESCCRNMNSTDRDCSRFTYPAPDPTNERPRADAGGNRRLFLLGDSAPLRGSVSDDGAPQGGRLTTLWTSLAGPGAAVFADETALETEVTFPTSGSYLVGLEARDGALLHIDTITVDVDILAGRDIEFRFQQGESGYRGTVDTFIYEGEPSADNSAAPSLEVDLESPGGSGQAKQSLLRFEGIFGDATDGLLPEDAVVRSAILELRTTNSGDGAFLHRMAESWSDRATWESLGGDGLRAGDETLGERDATAVADDGPTQIDVTASLRAWSADPSSNHGWALLPGGNDGWDFDSSEGEAPPQLTVHLPIVDTLTLVEIGDEWSFLPGSSDPPVDWNAPGFVPDAAWRRGPTGVGFGDDDDATLVTDMVGNYLTMYCRREFDVSTPIVTSSPQLQIDYDDGFVAYLNGVEFARSTNLGAAGAPVDRTTRPSTSHEAGVPEAFAVPPDLLVAGVNVLAIEVHNASIGSTDLSMIPRLETELLLIAPRSSWSYLPGREAPPDDWSSVDFDDSQWSRGRASIGYGGGDDFTVLEDMSGSYASVFCRAAFNIGCPATIGSLLLNAIVDDGAVVYLNGAEAGRVNMPAGEVNHLTLADSPRSGPASLEVPVSLLRSGRNVLAVSVHNAVLSSNDLSFAATLVPFLDESAAEDCGKPDGVFLRGDVVGDDRLNVSDAVTLLTALFQGGVELDCPDAADADDDGRLTLTDAIGILDFLFRAGRPLAPPGADCGSDPTDDALGACVRDGC